MTRPHPARGGGEQPDSDGAAAVVGTLDSSLRIDRISGAALTLFACPLERLLGESVLALLAEEDVPTFLMAYAGAARSQVGATLELDLCDTAGDRLSQAVRCEVFIVPLRPGSGCAFVLRPVVAVAVAPAAALVRGVSDHAVEGVGRLTTRERQIVSRLLDGHRPPGIARSLFLSQSTVRNHLGSVFRKLGVTSQEGLLELFRVPVPEAGDDEQATHGGGRLSRTS